MAHRWVIEKLYGKFPDGKETSHECGNKACVRPSHLKPRTHKENCQLRGKHRQKGFYLSETLAETRRMWEIEEQIIARKEEHRQRREEQQRREEAAEELMRLT